MLELADIRRRVARTGLGSKYISKDEKISMILRQISDLDMDIALKGGTAINRTYLRDNARFSEDIDLDLFGDIRIDKKIDLLRKKFEKIEGFEMSHPRLLYLTVRIDANYINEMGEKDRVMIDVYVPNSTPITVKPVEKRLIEGSIVQTRGVVLSCYSDIDLMAQKMLALDGRYEGKDVFDLFHSLKMDFDVLDLMKGLELRLELRKDQRNTSTFLTDLAEKRVEFMDRWSEMMNGTNHFIPRHLRPEWKGMINDLFDSIKKIRSGPFE